MRSFKQNLYIGLFFLSILKMSLPHMQYLRLFQHMFILKSGDLFHQFTKY